MGREAVPVLPYYLLLIERELRVDRLGRIEMRGAVGQHERHGLAGTHFEFGNRREILAAGLGRRPQHRHVLAGDRQQRSVLAAAHPGNVYAEAKADHELHPHLDLATDAADQSHDIGRLAARRHEVDQRDGAGLCLKARFEDEGIAEIAARRTGDVLGGRNQPAAVLARAEDGGKAGVGIEGRPAQPVDRAVAPDQRRGLAVTDQRVVLDLLRQCLASLGNRPWKSPAYQLPPGKERSRVAAFKAARSTLAAILSSATGRRWRQFGCSSIVPGMLGWSITPSRSSSDTANSRDGVRDRKASTE